MVEINWSAGVGSGNDTTQNVAREVLRELLSVVRAIRRKKGMKSMSRCIESSGRYESPRETCQIVYWLLFF